MKYIIALQLFVNVAYFSIWSPVNYNVYFVRIQVSWNRLVLLFLFLPLQKNLYVQQREDDLSSISTACHSSVYNCGEKYDSTPILEFFFFFVWGAFCIFPHFGQNFRFTFQIKLQNSKAIGKQNLKQRRLLLLWYKAHKFH